MDKQALHDGLQQMIDDPQRPAWDRMFLGLVQHVWQIDYTVDPLGLVAAVQDQDADFFLAYMQRDPGDEVAEWKLLRELFASGESPSSDVLIAEINQLREELRR